MAKDGSARGGARPGAGRKKKPLAERAVEGNVSHRPTEVLDFDDELEGVDIPPAKEYLSEKQKDGTDFEAENIYNDIWTWLKKRNCTRYINPQLVEQYSVAVARWNQCEKALSKYGFLAKHPTTNAPITSPFVSIGREYQKQANALWNQIYQVVKENCSTEFGNESNPSDDVMESLLRRRGG